MVDGRRLGGGGNSGFVGGCTRAPRPCASGWCASSARSNWWCGWTLARRRERGRESCPRGRRVNGSLRRLGRPSGPLCVFSFRVRCGFRRSLVLGSWLLTACGPSRRRPFRVEQSRREPAVARLVCVETARPLRGHARSRAESSPACGFSTGSVDGQTARPSGGVIGAERRRVENSRRRPSAAASTRASYGAGAAHLAAVLERDAPGRLTGCTAPWGRGAFHVGWTGALGPGIVTVRPCPRRGAVRWSRFSDSQPRCIPGPCGRTGMTTKRRRRFTADLKKRVALAALREGPHGAGDRGQARGPYPNQVSVWKRQAIQSSGYQGRLYAR